MVELLSQQFPRTYYQKSGQGFPLLLIHGFTEDAEVWNSQVNELSKNYLVITPDLPGSGNSIWKEEGIIIELMASFIQEIIVQENIDEFVLFGHSMGGYIALAYAEKYPHKLKALGLIHSTAFEDDEEKKTNRRKSMALIQNHEQGKEVFLQAMIPNLYAESNRIKVKDKINEHLTMAYKISSMQLVQYYQAMIDRPNRISVLENFKKPILFVIGFYDNAVSYSSSLQQCHLPLVSKVSILREVGHTSMYEASEQLTATMNSFTNDVLQI
jgi:pimeloyl-ACP methyl ester carboxylesterase